MYEVTQDYLDKATAAGRIYSLRVDVGEIVDGAYTDKAQYFGGVGVLFLKIVRGQTTGGFSLGGTVCAQLSATFTNDVDVRVKDRLQVYVRFGSGDDATAWRGLGWFYVDSVKQGLYSKSVTAYDAMLRLEKNYKSKLTYPAKTSDILNEISEQTKINLSSNLTLINDATVEEQPLKDKSKEGEQRYYTRREMLGYIGAINAGETYIDVDFKINIAVPTIVDRGVNADNVISQTVDDTSFTIDGIVWNKTGVSYSLNDEYTENTVELINPLGYAGEELILHNLETKLVGLSYSSITLKKQGTGIYQLGDLVSYTALDGAVYTMLVMGIVYDFSNGFFSETLYSLAKSASQQEYAGSQITDQAAYTTAFPPAPIMYTFKPFTNVDPAAGGGFEFKSSDGTAKFEISENGIQLFRKNAANGYRAYIGADTYLTAYVEDRYNSANVLFSPRDFSIGGSAAHPSGIGGATRYHLYSANGVLHGDARDDDGNLKAQINISSDLVINYGSTYRIYLSEGQLEITGSGENAMSLSLTANGLYVNGKKVRTED